jgi:hypothetical protein
MDDSCKPEAGNGKLHGSAEKILILDSKTLLAYPLGSFLSLYEYSVVYAPDVANELTFVEGE